jgi:hypothetical protein
MIIGYSDESINLLVRSSSESNIRRYCVDLAKLPNDHIINVTGFGWHNPYIASSSVNACNITDLNHSFPDPLPLHTLLILYEHECKITEHAWNVEQHFGEDISLMIISNRTNTHYELTYNTTAMPVAIPVLVFWQNDLDKINKIYNNNLTNIQISIDYPLVLPKKFRPAVLLMFILVFVILLGGNCWASDEFIRKIKNHNLHSQTETSSCNTSPISTALHDSISNNNQDEAIIPKPNPLKTNEIPKNSEPAIIYIPYCIIAVILCFAVGWLLLIFYFPKVMIYVLQGKYILLRSSNKVSLESVGYKIFGPV